MGPEGRRFRALCAQPLQEKKKTRFGFRTVTTDHDTKTSQYQWSKGGQRALWGVKNQIIIQL